MSRVFPGGSEDGSRVKRIRAGGSAVSRDPAQALDAPDPEPASAPAPPAFLSPSVKEYLELGMAIPGKCCRYIRLFDKMNYK